MSTGTFRRAIETFATEANEPAGDLLAAHLIQTDRCASANLPGTTQSIAETLNGYVISAKRTDINRRRQEFKKAGLSFAFVTMILGLFVMAVEGDAWAQIRSAVARGIASEQTLASEIAKLAATYDLAELENLVSLVRVVDAGGTAQTTLRDLATQQSRKFVQRTFVEAESNTSKLIAAVGLTYFLTVDTGVKESLSSLPSISGRLYSEQLSFLLIICFVLLRLSILVAFSLFDVLERIANRGSASQPLSKNCRQFP